MSTPVWLVWPRRGPLRLLGRYSVGARNPLTVSCHTSAPRDRGHWRFSMKPSSHFQLWTTEPMYLFYRVNGPQFKIIGITRTILCQCIVVRSASCTEPALETAIDFGHHPTPRPSCFSAANDGSAAQLLGTHVTVALVRRACAHKHHSRGNRCAFLCPWRDGRRAWCCSVAAARATTDHAV